jgi:trans-2,3-dihydro-3-hydroxyanthranilate isomerase
VRRFPYVTIDVFTDERFGGNPLAVFFDAEGLSDVEMQALASEMNYSETTFVLPPSDPSNDARVRIFHRRAEMPFAGQPNVGTAFALAAMNKDAPDTLRFEEMAGLVTVRIQLDEGRRVIGAEIDAPQPLQLLGELPAEAISLCVGLCSSDIVVSAHQPTRASVGVDFVLAEVRADGLALAAADLPAFRKTALDYPSASNRLSILLYVREGEKIRARMFSPISGTWEDPATGSANAALAALLLLMDKRDGARFEVTQGVEMGRPSILRLSARNTLAGIYATVGGSCVPVFSGTVEL